VHGLAAAVIGAFTSAGPGRGGGPALLFSGMFAAPGRPDWPHGVQEEDAPRFAVDRAAALRPGDEAGDPRAAEDEAVGEIIELFNRRLDSSIRGWLRP
jgi:hypothetical protein